MCGKCLISWNDIQRHMKYHAGDKSSLCALCVEEFISIRRHINITLWRIHNTVIYVVRYQSPGSDAIKIRYHCALCDIEFTFSPYMKKHMKLHPLENSYQCALCGKWFLSWNNKQWQMKSHAGDNSYLCALCNQELISRHNIQRPMKGHAMDNP